MNKETIKKELSFLCPVPELLKMKAEVVGRTITRKDLSFFYEGVFLCSVIFISEDKVYTNIQLSLLSEENNKIEAILGRWDGN